MFYTLDKVSYSVGIVKLVAFYAFYQQKCEELGVKLHVVSLYGQVVRASATGAEVSVLIWSRVKLITVNFAFTALLLDAQN